jgi:hypothetical protein
MRVIAISVAWLKLLALDSDLAKAAPKTLRTGSCRLPPVEPQATRPASRAIVISGS